MQLTQVSFLLCSEHPSHPASRVWLEQRRSWQHQTLSVIPASPQPPLHLGACLGGCEMGDGVRTLGVTWYASRKPGLAGTERRGPLRAEALYREGGLGPWETQRGCEG